MNGRRFLLIYASQTGQAKAIAEELCEKAETVGLQADIHCISTTEKKFWLERETLAVIISSTTGDGDSPDTALKFVRRLKKKTLPKNHLAQLKYAFLGLGDSNYTNFCNCGKMIDKRLSELGAQRFHPASFADDATGLEEVVEPWLDSVLPALLKELGVEPAGDNEKTAENCQLQTSAPGSHLKPTNQSTDSNVANDKNKSNVFAHKDQFEVKAGISSLFIEETGVLEKNKQAIIEDMVSDTTLKGEDELECMKDFDRKESPETKGGNIIPDDISIAEKGQGDMESMKETTKKINANGGESSTALSVVNDGKQESLVTGSQSVNIDESGSLTESQPPLSEVNLSVPLFPAAYIDVKYHAEQSEATSNIIGPDVTFPSAHSQVTKVPILRASQITSSNAVKTTLKLDLGITETGWDYMPGDSIGILCENTDQEVEWLLTRLRVTAEADAVCTLSLLNDTKKKNAKIPVHYPQTATLRHLFKCYCDIRAVPKKAFLRACVECCENGGEKRRLQELCSKQGSEDYTKYIRTPGLSLLDILLAFPSVELTPALILEHCPRLLPRPYSAASCSLKTPGRLSIVFNVVQIPKGEGRASHRTGLCTGMLSNMCVDLLKATNTKESPQELSELLDRVNIQRSNPQISVYLRTNQHFRPAEDLSVPCILIGPGTGIAPFIGFLQHRAAKLEETGSYVNKAGEMWLFFGCRHKERDFLFREDLEAFVKSGILTNLQVSFSRDDPENTDQPRYVQDNLKLQGQRMAELICEREARVYVCGDAKGMARNVNQTFIDILQHHKGLSEKESSALIMDMRIHKRYLEDVWT